MNSKIFHFSLKLYFGLNHKYLNICLLFRIYKNILLICIIYKYLKWKEFGFHILKCLIFCMATMSPFENFYLNKEIFFQYPEIFGRFFFSLAWQSCNHDITSYSKANCLSPVYKKLLWIKGGQYIWGVLTAWLLNDIIIMVAGLTVGNYVYLWSPAIILSRTVLPILLTNVLYICKSNGFFPRSWKKFHK